MALKVSAPIIALGTLAVRNWAEQENAVAQLRTAIESTGGAASLTLQQLTQEARRLQSETIFGDDTIIQGVTNQLLTFTNIAGNNFMELQQATLDVSSRLYGANANAETLRATSIMLGKALNDPIANLGALGRAGIQFSEQQKAVIKNLAENNRLADAQAIIIKELEKQYGGSAKAIAQSGLGPLKQFINLFMDALEPLGGAIVNVLTPIIPILTKMVNKMVLFTENNPKLTKMLVIIAGIAAAIAPMLLTFALIAKSVAVLLPLFAVIVSPVGLIVAGVIAIGAGAVLLYKKWEPFRNLVDSIWEKIKLVGSFIKAAANPIGAFLNKGMADYKTPKVSMSPALQGQNGRFSADINLNAPKGAVQSVKTKEKKATGFNLGFNMREEYA
jgi:hypothetical protein